MKWQNKMHYSLINSKWIWIACVLFITGPIIINFIVGIPHIQNTHIVGTNVDWLSFWSNYLGSFIASSVSILILYATINNARRERDIQLEREEIQSIRTDLAKRFSLYNPQNIIRLSSYMSLYSENFSSLGEEQKEDLFESVMQLETGHLQSTYEHYLGLLNSSKFIYDDIREGEFYQQYEQLIMSTIILIKEIINRNTSYSIKDIERIKGEMMAYSGRIEELSKQNKIVLNSGINYLRNRINKYNNLNNTQLI